MSSKTTPKATAKVSHAKSKTPPQVIAEIHLIPIENIKVTEQVRTIFDDESIKELAADIEARGLRQAIEVTPIGDEMYLLTLGERRLRAIKSLGHKSIPATIVKTEEKNRLVDQLAENIQREDLDLKDEVKAIRLLHDNLRTVQAVANTVKKSNAWVSKRLALSHPDLSYETRKLMEDNITEDVEILNIVNAISEISWSLARKLDSDLRKGEATRESAREMLKEAKNPAPAEIDPDQTQREQERKTANIENAKEREALTKRQTTGTGVDFIEQALHKLQNLCSEPDDIAYPGDDATAFLNGLSEPQRNSLLTYLQAYQEDAKTWTLSSWAKILTPYDSTASYIEQFVAVMIINGKGERLDNLYALVTILEQANRELEP